MTPPRFEKKMRTQAALEIVRLGERDSFPEKILAGREKVMEKEERNEKKELENPEVTTYSRKELEKPKTVFTGNPSVSAP